MAFRIIANLFASERDRWLLWAPAGIGVGIGVYFALPFEPSLAWLVASPALVAAAWLVRYRFAALLPLIVFLTFALGFNAGQIDTRLSYTPMIDREAGPLAVTGRLMFTEVMPDGVRLTLKDLSIGHWPPARVPVKFRVKFDNKTLADVPPPGTVVRLWSEVGPFSDPVAPHANDFRWQSYFRQLGGLGWSYSRIETVTDAPPPGLRDRLSLMFERARITLAQHVYARLQGDVAAMTAARLNGEQSGISEPVIRRCASQGSRICSRPRAFMSRSWACWFISRCVLSSR